ncbi:MAG: hypothetical protein ACOC25_05225 [Alkalispirochaetaceae bacterium]
MNRRIASFLLVLLILTPLPGVSQESSAETSLEDTDVFAPFVSRIRVAVREPQVRITWRDAEEIDGPYRIYRHTREISERTFENAELVATVEGGTETHLDSPPGPGEYYYAVLSESEDGDVYEIFIPFRNKTIQPAVISERLTDAEQAARVFNLSAAVVGNGIELTYDASRNGRELAIYRSTVPIRGYDSLSTATRITVVESIQRRYVDYPVPGVPYYYGAFDTAKVEAQDLTVETGENVLRTPIQVRIDAGEPSVNLPPRVSRRGTPLPLLRLETSSVTAGSGELARIPSPRSLDPPTREALDEILLSAGEEPPPTMEPVILPSERVADARGTAATLTEIIQDEFSEGNYQESARLLSNLLSITLEPDIAARARFYLGQSKYFTGEYRNAFLSFLLAQQRYHTESTPWMERILRILAESPESSG